MVLKTISGPNLSTTFMQTVWHVLKRPESGSMATKMHLIPIPPSIHITSTGHSKTRVTIGLQNKRRTDTSSLLHYTPKCFQYSPIFISLDEAAQFCVSLKCLKSGNLNGLKPGTYVMTWAQTFEKGKFNMWQVGRQVWAENSTTLFKILCLFLTACCHFRENRSKNSKKFCTEE